MSNRIQSKSYATRAEFEAAVNEAATLETRLRLLKARRDKRIQAVQDEFDADISAVKQEIDGILARAEVYAETHRGDLFAPGTKSAETELATYGFRAHPPALALLNRKWTWAAVLEALRGLGRADLIRRKEEADKDLIKASLDDATLASVGLRIEAKETFGITPKTEGGEAVQGEGRAA